MNRFILLSLSVVACAPLPELSSDDDKQPNGNVENPQNDGGATPSEDGEGSDGEGSDGVGSDDTDGDNNESSDGEDGIGEGSDSEDGIGEGSDGEGSDGEGSDNDRPDPDDYAAVASGTWESATVELLDDPCHWNQQIPNFFSTVEAAEIFDIAQLLPRTFDVVGFETNFEIEARRFGTAAPIDCETDGAVFSCETQEADSVYPNFRGFTYFIDFNGSVVDSGYVEGTATVRYEVNEYWETFLSRYDVSVAECTQVFQLALQHN